ncbi:Dienelactone hydrolase family protein [Minicystis rosea]|nr:Dienelactone hydrolase family protein [Minicystis rosea]
MAATMTDAEKALSETWHEHIAAEFAAHSPDAAIHTMTGTPRVNQIPVMIGGDGRAQVCDFYSKHFLHQIPPDWEMTSVSRTIGQGRLVDELLIKFTHTIAMDWMLPGVPPTGKRVEMALVVIVQFEGDKMAQENLYWDQASVLVQLGLLDPEGLPVVGAEGARSVLDRSIPLNGLIARAHAARSRPTATSPASSPSGASARRGRSRTARRARRP